MEKIIEKIVDNPVEKTVYQVLLLYSSAFRNADSVHVLIGFLQDREKVIYQVYM